MHKFLFLVLIAYRLGAMESEELAPEFRVPPIVMQMARYGVRQFELDQVPLIYKVEETIWPDVLAETTSKHLIEQRLDLFSLDVHIEKETGSARPAERFDVLIAKIFSGACVPQDSIVLFPDFFKQSYGRKKATILHELWHIKQCTQRPYYRTPIPLDPLTYPHGIEQEADMCAARATNCHLCTEEFARMCPCESEEYANEIEILAIAHKMPEEQLCSYHRLLLNNPLYRTLQNQRLSNVASLACCCFGLAGTVKGRSKLEKILYFMLGLTGGLGIDAIFGSDSLKNFIEHGVEEKIARGELEP